MSPIFMKLFTGILQTKIHIQLISLTSQSNILVVKKYQFIEKSVQCHVLTGITQMLVIVGTPFWSHFKAN